MGNSDEFLQTVNALDALRWWNSSSDKEISQNIRRNENAACGGCDICITTSIVGKFAVRLSVNWPSLMWTIWSNFGLKFEWFEMWRKHLNDGILLAQLEQFFDYFLLRIDYTSIPVSAPWQLLKTTTFSSRVECAYTCLLFFVVCRLIKPLYRPCNEKVVWETLRWMCWLNKLNPHPSSWE